MFLKLFFQYKATFISLDMMYSICMNANQILSDMLQLWFWKYTIRQIWYGKHGNRIKLSCRIHPLTKSLQAVCQKITSFALINSKILIRPVRLLFSLLMQIQLHTDRLFMKRWNISDYFSRLWCKFILQDRRQKW
jgi:hypothetical protein